ncbi:MAG: GAF domain-containing protein [Candidatus Hydrogenedentes bacterium]|nr:GAF domain-containing protein [Candidatus Hydrogenedentota bacterium]
MRVILVIAEERSIRESIRAAWPEGDLLLFEDRVEAAGRRLVSLQADAIVLDDSPGLGMDALAPIKALAPGTPVIVLTARGDLVTQAAFARCGADACAPKPFSCEALRAEVERLTAPPPVQEAPLPSSAPHGMPGAPLLQQHQMALRWLSRASSHSEDPGRLSHALIEATVDIFGAARSAVLLEEQGLVRVAASQGLPDNIAQPLRLSFSAGLMRWFDAHACLIDRHAVEAPAAPAGLHAAAAAKEMRLLHAVLGAPLIRAGQVFGAVLLGERVAGGAYTVEERELLALVARCVSLAFDRAQSHAEIARRQARLDRVLAHINAGVVTIAPDKTVVMMNQSAERLLNVRAIDLVGRSVQRLGSAFADVVLRTLSDGTPRLRCEFHDPAINATLGLSATPLGEEGVVVVFSRLPERDEGHDELALSPVWGYLASRVAQEIKNPMVAISTYAQLLPKKYDAPDFRDSFSDVVQNEVARINAVVETLYAFAETPRLALEATNVDEAVRHVLDVLRDEMREHAITVDAELQSGGAQAEIDSHHFGTAVANVLRNAIDAMAHGGTLSVRTSRENGCIEVRVTDTGPGIAQQDAANVFLPFFSTKERGMGLGLAIANRIMKQHKGDIRLLHSEKGGSCFALQLPASGTPHANHTRGG